jgi:polar amino acid transport system substrate-binding protein
MRLLPALGSLLILAAAPARAAQEVDLYLMEVRPYTIDSPEKKGMVGDVVLEALRRTGYQPKIVVVPSPRALLIVPTLENTLIIPLARLRERDADFTWIARIMTVERAFFSLDKKVKSFAEAKANFSLIGVARGSAGYRILLDQGFGKEQLVEVNQGAMAPRMLRAKRFDAWYSPVLEAQALQKEVGGPAFVAGVPLGSTEQYLGCSKICDETMVSRLAGALRSMQKEGVVQKIISTYQQN